MSDRERQFAELGIHYSEGIESSQVVVIPESGREIRKTKKNTWEVQPWNDNYWLEFEDIIDAIKAGIRPNESVTN